MEKRSAVLRGPQTENSRRNVPRNHGNGKYPTFKSKPKKNIAGTKIVLRLLSPDMTEDEFNQHTKDWFKPEILAFKYFVAGKPQPLTSGKPPATSTAYIGFRTHQEAEKFRKDYNNIFRTNVNEYSMAEYAPFQKGMSKPKPDNLASTIEQDEYYNSFVAHLNDSTIPIIPLVKIGETEKSEKKAKKQKKSEKSEKKEKSEQKDENIIEKKPKENESKEKKDPINKPHRSDDKSKGKNKEKDSKKNSDQQNQSINQQKKKSSNESTAEKKPKTTEKKPNSEKSKEASKKSRLKRKIKNLSESLEKNSKTGEKSTNSSEVN